MTDALREAAQEARIALQCAMQHDVSDCASALAALDSALAEPQEPASPTQWQDLTITEINEAIRSARDDDKTPTSYDVARAIEAALRAKNAPAATKPVS